jgi:AsmA protein
LLQDALGKDAATVEGTTALKLDVFTRGETISTLKKQLEGSIDLQIVRGKLRNKKFAEKLERLIAILQSRQPRHPDETVLFDSFSATWIPKEGILVNEDLRLATELIHFRGQGNIDLLQETVDYSLFPVLSGKDRDVLLAPITVAGPFSDLQYGLDVTRFSRNQLKRSTENLSEGLQTQSERLKSGIKETTEDIKQKLQEGMESIKRTFRLP